MHIAIPSVNYDDFLRITLPAWCKLVPSQDITIVTAPNCPDRKVAEANGCKVVETDVWYGGGAKLNEAAALDVAFADVPNGDICLSLDADIYPVGEFPEQEFEDNILYGIARHQCPQPSEFADFIAGNREIESYPSEEFFGVMKPGRCAPICILGYFQMFRMVHERHIFGNYPTAEFYDIAFAAKHNYGEVLSELCGLHLGPTKQNWDGRHSERWS